MTTLAVAFRGVFDWRAGIEMALIALRRAVDAGVTIDAEFAGDGPERERLLYTIHDLGLEDVVRVVAADAGEPRPGGVLLHPALRAGDLTPLRRALARGTKVVASDLPETRALLRDGGDLRLVPPRDVIALADALIALAGATSSGESSR